MRSKRNSKTLANRVVSRCRELARFSEVSGSTQRTFLSPPMRDCHCAITSWLEKAGAQTTIDAVGNLRAFYAGANSTAGRLMIGSHLDTVPNAGAFDGVLGVILATALIEALDGKRLPFGIEVVGFSEEEGVRFGTPFIGSRALVGRIDQNLLELRDAQGTSVRRAIENFGLAPDEIPNAVLRDDVLGYLEFHIEQGPVLQKLRCPLAVVDTIAGQSRLEYRFIGEANHAGTTPMHLRRDAMQGAAEWIGDVEEVAKGVAGLVATVGCVTATPGAINVIAGEVKVSLDVRHKSDRIRLKTVEQLSSCATATAKKRGLALQRTFLLNKEAVSLNKRLADEIGKAIEKAGCELHRMVSGAGHDAMIMAEKVPVGMVFLRSSGGASHSPEESVMVEDIAKAIDCGLYLLDQLACSSKWHAEHASL